MPAAAYASSQRLSCTTPSCSSRGFSRRGSAERQSLSCHHAQGRSLDELHRDVAIVANDTRLVDRDDVRVIQRRGERGLARQAIERVVAASDDVKRNSSLLRSSQCDARGGSPWQSRYGLSVWRQVRSEEDVLLSAPSRIRPPRVLEGKP